MKAFLLAAGNGTRLRPFTDRVPKCLVPIQGTPLLGIWLAWCAQYGIGEVLVNCHAHSEMVRDYVAAYGGPVEVTLSEEPSLLGSAGTIHANRDFVAGEREFAVLYADVLTDCRFDKLLEFHRLRKAPVTVGYYHAPNPAQCGILSTASDGRVLDFTEKPSQPKADTAFSGLLIGGPDFLAEVPERIPADLGFDVLPRLVGKMFAFPIEGFILDIGTAEKYEYAQKNWKALEQL